MIKVGIFMGGSSREREISFAGGRTVYDNLDKSIFEAIPIFVDSVGKFIQLDWSFIYKGTIRDFFPPAQCYPDSNYQFYLEHIDCQFYNDSIKAIGKEILIQELSSTIDFAFLTLHGLKGEDGSIQGLLEWLNIPYSGSGLLGSAIGIDKIVQKELMQSAGFEVLSWIKISTNQDPDLKFIEQKIGFPLVLKNPLQGSSIGTAIVKNKIDFFEAYNKVCFITKLKKLEWNSFTDQEKKSFIHQLSDIRHASGFPLVVINHEQKPIIQSPHLLENWINENPQEEYIFQAFDAAEYILIEKFIDAKEFSVIVIEDEEGNPIALPPTEIRKKTEIFDYKSKYLPGIANKITPIHLELSKIEAIANKAAQLMKFLQFNVYARIDGFITSEGKIYFNDPNTTSGMLPSSFFFHQAAEIGLNPAQFLMYIIKTSLLARKRENRYSSEKIENLIKKLDKNLDDLQKSNEKRKKIAVIMGGYSAERHISVESGRNIFEKLNGAGKYQVTPVFLRKNEIKNTDNQEPAEFSLFSMPASILLKDNADDIAEKIKSLSENPEIHPFVKNLLEKTNHFLEKYRFGQSYFPRLIPLKNLKEYADFVFIAIHGRPGEDGQLQTWLEKINIPYNGSNPDAAALAMDKFKSNEVLHQNGMNIAAHALVEKDDFETKKEQLVHDICQTIPFPWIAKPVDEGCSAAVKKIKNITEAKAYLSATFRESEPLSEEIKSILKISDKEEFPIKNHALIENFLQKEADEKFLEVTVGFVSHAQNQGIEVFSPSETLSESEILSLEEKFLAGQGQNITPARFSDDPKQNAEIETFVKSEIEKCAKILGLSGYARIDAFVQIPKNAQPKVWIIEANTLPGMTPATCIFHQAALSGYSPLTFIEKIIAFGESKNSI